MSYAEEVAADRRHLILAALKNSAGYTAPQALIETFLAAVGRKVAADVLQGDVAWLQRNGLIVPAPAECWTLTQAGLDVANDLAQYPGVRRPRLGE